MKLGIKLLLVSIFWYAASSFVQWDALWIFHAGTWSNNDRLGAAFTFGIVNMPFILLAYLDR